MSHRLSLRILAAVLLVATLSVLVGLGMTAFRQALAVGSAEAWLMAWVLAFVVGLPVLVVLLAVLGAVQRYSLRLRIIPLTGVKIPGAGQ
jgi:hypothetical protein